jgi:hypothetical protein
MNLVGEAQAGEAFKMHHGHIVLVFVSIKGHIDDRRNGPDHVTFSMGDVAMHNGLEWEEDMTDCYIIIVHSQGVST